jgi:hypothetical protein
MVDIGVFFTKNTPTVYVYQFMFKMFHSGSIDLCVNLFCVYAQAKIMRNSKSLINNVFPDTKTCS